MDNGIQFRKGDSKEQLLANCLKLLKLQRENNNGEVPQYSCNSNDPNDKAEIDGLNYAEKYWSNVDLDKTIRNLEKGKAKIEPKS